MNELQLGLIGAGAVIVIGVIFYNGMQGRRVRRKLPRTMPPNAGQGEWPSAAPHQAPNPLDGDEHLHDENGAGVPFEPPFIHAATHQANTATKAGSNLAAQVTAGAATAPAAASTKAGIALAPAAVVPAPLAGSDTGPAAEARNARREPGFGDRREPSFGTAAVRGSDTSDMPSTADTAGTPVVQDGQIRRPADGQDVQGSAADTDALVAAAAVMAMSASTPDDAAAALAVAASRDAGDSDGLTRRAAASTAQETGMNENASVAAKPASMGVSEPMAAPQSPTTTVSSAPPMLVDRRIDCIVPLQLGEPLSGERVIPLAIRLRRAGSKPVVIEGCNEVGEWGPLRAGVRYGELRATVQLANRSGPLNELEFSEFVGGVHRLADAIDAAAEFPDMAEVVQMARELDAFAAQCDAQLSINVLSDGAPWSGSYVQAVASQDGLLLSRDGTRFVKLDAKQSPVFTLTFEGTNFLRDDLTYKGGHMITLLLDVPVADEDILPWRLMCDYARSLGQRMGARVVDDQRRVLPDASLQAIDDRLMSLYERLEKAGLPAGSPAARRLFSS